MKRVSITLLFLLAACTQEPAPVDYQGSKYYGRDGVYDHIGNELPKYSADHPAPMASEQSAKYQSSQMYGSPAEVTGVSSSDLPPPSAAVNSGISSSTYPPPGEIGVPASASRVPAPAESGATPFKAATPPPSPPAVQPSQMAAPVPPLNGEQSRITTTYPTTQSTPAPAPAEPDYYSQEAAAPHPDPAMMDSDATTSTAASPAPVASQPAFIWPVKGDILSGFGSKAGGKTNDGINIKGMKGDPIRAAADGKVTYAGDGVKALGNMVVVDHGNGWVTNYAHASELVVKKGQSVVKGQLLGFVGTSGSVSDPQLHFAIRHNGTPADPKALLIAD